MSRGNAGFTLIEALVALTILGLSLVVLTQIFSQGTRNIAEIEARARAMAIAEGVLAETMNEPLAPLSSDTNGSEHGFDWSVQTRPFTASNDNALPNGDYQLNHVEVIVEWTSGRTRRSVTLDSLKLVRR